MLSIVSINQVNDPSGSLSSYRRQLDDRTLEEQMILPGHLLPSTIGLPTFHCATSTVIEGG